MLSKEKYEITIGINNILRSLSLAQEVLQNITDSVAEINAFKQGDYNYILGTLEEERKILEASINQLLKVFVKCNNVKRSETRRNEGKNLKIPSL